MLADEHDVSQAVVRDAPAASLVTAQAAITAEPAAEERDEAPRESMW